MTETRTPPPTADTTPTNTAETIGRSARNAYAVPVTANKPSATEFNNATS